VDDAPSQLDEALERLREIGHAEVGQREAIARAAATLVQSERWVSLAGLEALAFALLALVERDVEQRLPEASGACEFVSGELDQISGIAVDDAVSRFACGVARLLYMLIIVGSILLALFVAPAPWGVVLVGCAIVFEVGASRARWCCWSVGR
jgi:hypothetical protein